MNLTGVCIYNPTFSMVYVEGAAKFIKNYKRLMMNRIVWTEAARPRGDTSTETPGEGDGEGATITSGGGEAEAVGEPVAALPEGIAQMSLEDNACWLVWEGQLRDRAFSGFKVRACPTDGTAKEFLGAKLSGYWDQAKNWKEGEGLEEMG
jgi:U4/U6 small nuclear ribonucleoprotein PRP3